MEIRSEVVETMSNTSLGSKCSEERAVKMARALDCRTISRLAGAEEEEERSLGRKSGEDKGASKTRREGMDSDRVKHRRAMDKKSVARDVAFTSLALVRPLTFLVELLRWVRLHRGALTRSREGTDLDLRVRSFFFLLYLLFSSSSLTARRSIMARALASFLALAETR